MNPRKLGQNLNRYISQLKWTKRGAVVLGGSGFVVGSVCGFIFSASLCSFAGRPGNCSFKDHTLAAGFVTGLITGFWGGIAGFGADLITSKQFRDSISTKINLNFNQVTPKTNLSKASLCAAVVATSIGLGYAGGRFFSEKKPNLTDRNSSSTPDFHPSILKK